MHNLQVIKSSTVRKILDSEPQVIQNLIKKAYIMHDNEQTVNPNSFFLRFPDKPKSRIIGLPAALTGDDKISGIKWIASNPDNIKINKPRASAVMILNDYETGFPLACLDGTYISCTRTAVSAVLAAATIKRKTGKKVTRVGLVGAGPIMQCTLQNLLANKDFTQIASVQALDLDKQRAANLLLEVEKANNNIKCGLATSLNDLINESDLIVFATSALEPYVDNLDLMQHKPIILNISLRDIAPNVILNSNNITDDIQHVLHANTSLHLAQQQVNNINFISGELGALLQDKFQISEDRINIFSPMGLGVLDLILAQYVYRNAMNANLCETIADFLCVDA